MYKTNSQIIDNYIIIGLSLSIRRLVLAAESVTQTTQSYLLDGTIVCFFVYLICILESQADYIPK